MPPFLTTSHTGPLSPTQPHIPQLTHTLFPTTQAYTYKGDSGKSVNCYYCPNCTSHAYHHQEVMGPDTIVVRTVLLDNGTKFKPSAEIYGKAKMSWEPEVAKTFDMLPPS